METTTFEQLPALVSEVNRKLDRLLSLHKIEPEKDRYLGVDDLMEYLPEKPARQTVYGWVNNRKIPYSKHGKRLYFLKSQVDNWIANGRRI